MAGWVRESAERESGGVGSVFFLSRTEKNKRKMDSVLVFFCRKQVFDVMATDVRELGKNKRVPSFIQSTTRQSVIKHTHEKERERQFSCCSSQ